MSRTSPFPYLCAALFAFDKTTPLPPSPRCAAHPTNILLRYLYSGLRHENIQLENAPLSTIFYFITSLFSSPSPPRRQFIFILAHNFFSTSIVFCSFVSTPAFSRLRNLLCWMHIKIGFILTFSSRRDEISTNLYSWISYLSRRTPIGFCVTKSRPFSNREYFEYRESANSATKKTSQTSRFSKFLDNFI